MKRNLLLLTVVSCLAGLSASQQQATPRADRCNQVGDIICDATCSSLVLCMDDPDSEEFRQEVIEKCVPDRYCYAPQRGCISVNTCDAATRPPFECTSVSVFPDPYTCTDYHICTSATPSGFTDHLVTCDVGYAYDPYRKLCSYKFNGTAGYPRVCEEGPVPQCTSSGGPFETLQENPSIYYGCKAAGALFYPVLYECAHGETYPDPGCQVQAPSDKTINNVWNMLFVRD